MKYYRVDKLTFKKEEISYDKALDICLGCYQDNDMTRDMLTVPNNIICRHSYIIVEDNGMVLMPGLYNALPMDTYYDDSGKRI